MILEREDATSGIIYSIVYFFSHTQPTFAKPIKSAQRNILQLDLYSNEIYGFYTSNTGKSFSGRTTANDKMRMLCF